VLRRLEHPVEAVEEQMLLPTEPSDEQLDRLADRIAELLERRLAARLTQQLVDAQAIAVEFGVSRKWVYEHADALGVVRLGRGRNRRLRFDRAIVRARLTSVGSLPEVAKPRRSRRRASAVQGELLAIRARRAAK
jgi:hypothetical protein